MVAIPVKARRRRRLVYAGLAFAGLLVWTIGSLQGPGARAPIDAGQMMAMRSAGPVVTAAAPAPGLAGGRMQHQMAGARGGGGAAGRAMGGAGFESAAQTSPWPVSPMLVRTASLSLRVEDVLKAQDRIGQLARLAGGYVADSDVSSDSKPAFASITVRVPNLGLDDLIAQVAGVGRLLSRKVAAQEVTEEYVDLASRKRNLEREELRLLDLLKHAGRVRDLLEVENEVGRVRGQVETIAGRTRYLENRVALSTLQVQLVGPQPAVKSGSAWAARDVLRQAASSLLSTGRALATVAIWLGVFAPVWLPVLLGMVWRSRRRQWTLRPQEAPAREGS